MAQNSNCGTVGMADGTFWIHFRKDRLLWVATADGREGSALAVADELRISCGKILRLEKLDIASNLKLEHPRYDKKVLGAIHRHGPLDLDTIWKFCKEVQIFLTPTPNQKSLCVTCSLRPGSMANSLLLLGAHLILQGRAADEVICKIHGSMPRVPTSVLQFPLPLKKRPCFGADSLTLADCLLGFEVAKCKGWLWQVVEEEKRQIARAYDVVPLFSLQLQGGDQRPVTVQFWIGADPSTTVEDPSQERLQSWSAWPEDLPTKIADGERCLVSPPNLATFAQLLRQKLGCCLLVRSSFCNEPHLPRGSYGQFFQQFGIKQLDVPFDDGTAPPPKFVSKVITVLKALLKDVDLLRETRTPESKTHALSVVVHCGGGLGRSMSLLAALAVALIPGLSAGAFFGWARLVRPACLFAPVQERLVRSLDEMTIPAGLKCGVTSWLLSVPGHLNLVSDVAAFLVDRLGGGQQLSLKLGRFTLPAAEPASLIRDGDVLALEWEAPGTNSGVGHEAVTHRRGVNKVIKVAFVKARVRGDRSSCRA